MREILQKKSKNAALINNPKISIITVCYNSAKTIEDTLKSVANQTYNNIEYIVVDGLSKDNTLEIVSKYKNSISKIVSEKDNGLYDAINKGIKMSTGDVVGIINSDDVLADDHSIEKIARTFKENDCEATYADLIYTDESLSKIVRNWKSRHYKPGLFLSGWMPAHPTFYAQKSLFEKYGYYDTSFKISADYELMLRFMHKHKIKVRYIEQVLVKMRTGGVSNSSIQNRIQANLEDRRAWKINQVRPSFSTLIKKPLQKVLQYLSFF